MSRAVDNETTCPGLLERGPVPRLGFVRLMVGQTIGSRVLLGILANVEDAVLDELTHRRHSVRDQCVEPLGEMKFSSGGENVAVEQDKRGIVVDLRGHYSNSLEDLQVLLRDCEPHGG
jgi:hypothetical protein